MWTSAPAAQPKFERREWICWTRSRCSEKALRWAILVRQDLRLGKGWESMLFWGYWGEAGRSKPKGLRQSRL